uniref:CCHC-type domain-containing protein n=1 Tax=Trichuris muris TaxID=70415 RepID=A0A5S6QLB9_TRIMR
MEDLDEMLRERLVCGIRNEALQRRLFAEKDLDFATALSLAQAFESAPSDVSVIRSAGREHVDIERLHVSSRQGAGRRWQNEAYSPPSRHCDRCGDDRHSKDECPFRKARCRFCSRIGHVQRACRAMQIAQTAKSPNRRRRYVRNQLLTHKIRDIDDASSQMQSGPDNIASLYTIDSGKVACSPLKTILLHVDAIRDEEEPIRFLQEKGILHRERYCSCGKPMTLAASTTGRSSRWRCHRATCRTEVALRKGTWFEGTHCP